MWQQMWQRLTRRSSSRTPIQNKRRAVLGLETLGARNLLSTGVFINTLGQLVIKGDEGQDTAQVSITGTNVTVDLNGTQSSFALSRVRSLVFKGEGGNDSFTNNTNLASLVFGGAGDDSIVGGGGSDTCAGQDGNDTIRGRGGRDVLNGGNGSDDLSGDDGNDQMYGGLGDDSMRGGSGDDLMGCSYGNDDAFGDDGRDSINGSFGNDSVEGGLGDDSLSGSDGDDSVRGGSGDDNCSGGNGNDDLSGDDGRDSLSGGSGRDYGSSDDGDSRSGCEDGTGAIDFGNAASVVTESENNNVKGLADVFAFDAGGTARLLGTSANHDDKDFFAFRASSSGTVSVVVTSPNGTFAQVEIENAGSVDVFETEPNDGINSGSFAVTAGMTYFVRLRATGNSAAQYQVDFTLA